jgi:hypothetical protein
MTDGPERRLLRRWKLRARRRAAETRATYRTHPTYRWVRWSVLRLLALTYLAAFASLWVQVEGLVGPQGIAPAERLLDSVAERFGADRFSVLPTLAWWTGASAGALQALCAAGVAASLLLLAGVASGPAALCAWALYLSLLSVGGPFLSFQWDTLLLETGFAALLLAPWRVGSGIPSERNSGPPSLAALWVLRTVLFKLILLSGLAKITSGDPTWRDLSALSYHHLTTCLPTWTGWFAHKLPDGLHRASTGMTLVVELALPFAILVGRRGRLLAFAAFVLLQLGIAATGNYGFFNLLTFALCASLLDDQVILRAANFLPRRARARLARAVGEDASPSGTFAISAQRLRSALAVGLLLLGVSRLSLEIVGVDPLAGIAPDALRQASRWHVVNSYGLFAVMTTERSEIVIEGSEDGVQWREYGFHWKPGDLGERPRFALLHMPRLDWQMWFAALSSPQRQRWFASFLRRVHEGSPAVLGLLAHDPFSGAPPRFLRARLYDYRFSHFAAWRASGEWWTREPGRLYLGPLERRWAPHRPIPPRP